MKTVLQVTTSGSAQKLLSRMLGDQYEVLGASGFREGKKALEEHETIDCFIVDYDFDNVQSFELINIIRSYSKYKKTAVILMAASVDNNLAYYAMQHDVNETIPKLISPKDLSTLVKEQIADPAISVVFRTSVDFECIRFFNKAKYYEMCPDLNITVEAGTEVMAHEKMKEELQAAVNGSNIGQTIKNISVVRHSVVPK